MDSKQKKILDEGLKIFLYNFFQLLQEANQYMIDNNNRIQNQQIQQKIYAHMEK